MACCGKRRKQFQEDIAKAQSANVPMSRAERIKLRQERIKLRAERIARRNSTKNS